MYRLNKRAFEILFREVEHCSGKDDISKIERQIVMKRLEKLRREKGSPANLDELRDTVVDTFPKFSEKVLKQAVKANQSPGFFSKIKWVVIITTSATGIIWVVNLPYPMIRKPIAKTAPILLLPSFINMDYHYREAIKNLEQGEQLINKATSTADIELGAEKVKAAQKNLDNLPIWFLGYYPQAYCGWFGCSWKFTFDEFEAARRKVAQLDAVVFQDKNALTPLEQAEKAVIIAKQQYEQASNYQEKQQAIASWEAAIDKLEQIPQQTLAGQTAQTKLKAYKRDFENAQIATFITAANQFDLEAEKIKQKQPQIASDLWQQAVNHLNQIPQTNPRYLEAQKLVVTYQVKLKTVVNPRSSTLILAAKQYAFTAAKSSQNPPHPAAKWEQIADLWQKAIEQLENIQIEESSYVEAQKLLAEYQTNLGIITTRKKAENEAQEVIKQINQQIQSLIANPPAKSQDLKNNLQEIITQLKTIKPGTTAYAEAQQLLISANNRQNLLRK
ncbi:MAG: hypothetical protein ACR9NN_04070 [Nostochopsis sp.]